MGIMDNLKAFMHSITTEDHYASYDSPYKSSLEGGGNVVGGNLNSRSSELNRLATINSSSQSLVGQEANGVGGNVGYRPGLRSSNLNSSSELPLQTFDASGQPPLPSIDSMWDRLESWLDEEYPELGDNLNDGATTADLNEFENDLGSGPLPVEFRQFYKRHDGQFSGGNPTGLIFGLELLDLESIVGEHAIWGKVAQRLEKQQYMVQNKQLNKEGSSSSDAQINSNSNSFISHQRSIPPNSIQSCYVHRGWIPIIKDDCGNLIALDIAPGSAGKWGQIIIFGREFDTKLVVAQSFQEFVFDFVSDLENGNFEIDQSNTNDAYGFLENSRDDDYMIGAEEDGQGELTFYDRDNKEFGKGIDSRRLTYLEVLKRRALKKYGLSNDYSTSFVPQRMRMKIQAEPGAKPGVPVGNTSSQPKNNSAPLIKLESTTDVSLPKETLIDQEDTSKKPIPKSTTIAEVKDSAKEATHNEKALQAEKVTTEPPKESKDSNESEAKETPEVKDQLVIESKEKDHSAEEQETVNENKEVDSVSTGLKDVEL
ncbi:uncharacterized protein PRCAT00001518001 [Priceomyces carsonii]|uniref:uncharacterized protein n=1 Tax=Priceomyces carsonii TaxID=28549 RepID=UPI002ED91B4D|nr:unnamed protein product [Priceomyces carsonii]